MRKGRRAKILAAAVLAVLVLAGGRAAAESDGARLRWMDAPPGAKIIHYQIDYYIPMVPGGDSCYGAYRVLSQTGFQSMSADVGVRKIRFSEDIRKMRESLQEGQDRMKTTRITEGADEVQNIASLTDIRSIARDDVIILTDLSLTTSRVEEMWVGTDTVHVFHHNFHYETPKTVIGYVAEMNPANGSTAGRGLVVVDRRIISKYMPDFTPDILSPGFQAHGNDPRGAVLSLVATPEIPSLTGVASVGLHNYFGYTYGKASGPSIYKAVQNTVMGKGGHYRVLATLDPENTGELVGWWTMFSQTVLRHIDEVRRDPDKYLSHPAGNETALIETVRKDLASQQGELERQGATPPGIFSTLLNYGVALDMDPQQVRAFQYEDIKSHGAPGQVWRMDMSDPHRALLNSHEMTRIWEGASKLIADATDEAYQKISGKDGDGTFRPWGHRYGIKVLPPRQVSPEGPLNRLTSTSPGVWSSPLTGGDFYSDSFMVFTNDPATMAAWPFSRAQNMLYATYDAKTRTLSEYSGPAVWSEMAGSAGAMGSGAERDEALGRMTSGLPVGRFGRLMDFVDGRDTADLWNDPWLPGEPDQGDPWKYWYDTNRQLYTDIVPYMALRMSITMMDMPQGSVAWGKGIERQTEVRVHSRWKGTSEGIRQVLIKKGVQPAGEPLIDASAEKMRDYTGRDVLYRNRDSEAIDWMLKNREKVTRGEGSTDLFTNMADASTARAVTKYFPLDADMTVAWIREQFPFVVEAGIDLLDTGSYRTCWDTFWRFDKDSGRDLAPKTWPLPSQYYRTHYEK